MRAGKTGVQFYTQIKTVAQQWRDLPSLGVSLSMFTSFEMETTSRGISSALPPSDRDSPSPAMSQASERDSPRCGKLPHEDFPNSQGSSLPSVADDDISNQGASLVLPTAGEQDLAEQEISLTMAQTSEGMYIPQTSQWNETQALTSQRTENISSSSQRIYVPTSNRNSNVVPSSKRTDAAMALTSECVYVPTPHESDNMGPISHTNDSMAPSSHRADGTVHQASERLYDLIATPHLDDNVSQTFQRTDTMFPTSERRYIPATALRNDHVGSTSQRPDIASHPTSERIYITSTSQRTDNMIPASQRADAVPPTSETIYMPPIVQRNNGVQPTSERLYMPPTSQRMYTENPIISMDDFPGQGTPMNLPTSQRI